MKALAIAWILCVSSVIAAPKKPAASAPAKTSSKSENPKPDAAKPAPAEPPAGESLPAPTRQNEEAQQAHAEALRLFQRGDLEGAARGFLHVLELAPENPPALINLALVRQRQKNATEAEHLLKRVLRNDPGNASAWLILGIAAYNEGNLDAAHAHLAQAVLYAPKNAQARQYLGVTLGRKGWYSAGEDELRHALEIDPKFAEAHYNLAVLYMERVPPAVELARRHYQKALENGAAPDPELAKKIGD